MKGADTTRPGLAGRLVGAGRVTVAGFAGSCFDSTRPGFGGRSGVFGFGFLLRDSVPSQFSLLLL
ncbi:hypothetical protein FRUB_07522 [Fimbriiglobus ruber]|uniref:Uncharacterized protein n=1 Tax=Fimbriiglobus ruber TaxID=1908690 RepID=A0A225DAC1_9BACT|nr:hypothetical protein FRUB_07522 [Fimbriiglobus ruber]